PLALAFPLAQRVHNALPYPRQPPAAKIAIDRVSIADIRGHHAPLAPRLVDVENTIDDTAEVHRLPPWSPTAPLGRGQQQLEGCPLRIVHSCGIVPYGAHRPSPTLDCVCREVCDVLSTTFSSPWTDLS